MALCSGARGDVHYTSTLSTIKEYYLASNPSIKPANLFKMFTTDASTTPGQKTDYSIPLLEQF
jgi:hypothetical protein